MKHKRPMTTVEAWILLIAGLIMGTVFTFGMQYWNAPITQEDAVCATALYESCSELKKNGHVREMILRFEDHEQLYIDGACITEELRNEIHGLAPGTRLSLMIHPNSNNILDLRVGDSVLLDFQNASEKLTGEATGFMVLGLCCYVLSVCGLVNLLFKKRR